MPAAAWVLIISLVLSAPPALAAVPPLADEDLVPGTLRIVVFGDFNGPYGSLEYPSAVGRVVRAITDTWKPDLVLMPGDLVAGQDVRLPDERFGQMWAVFDRDVAEPLRRAGIPYAPTMGNHDASSERLPGGGYRFQRERDAARAYWTSSLAEPVLDYVDRSDLPFRYAFRAGDAFVAVVDASSATLDAATRAWLAEVLATPEARGAATRLVMGHLPLYPIAVGRDRPGEYLNDANAIQALLEAHGVDTYVSGHHHAYYPGRVGGLELLYAGAVGGRRILGHDAPARSAVTVVDLWFDPLVVRYASFDPTDMRPIRAGTLPMEVVAHGVRVLRSDRGPP